MTNWEDRADCRGEDLQLFFEGYECEPALAVEVDRICSQCPVKTECLTMGIRTAGTGVHGGVYIALGHFSKARNKHKSQESQDEYKRLIKSIKEEL